MKVIFLDIDGVLNTRRSMDLGRQGQHPPGDNGHIFTVDPLCVSRLRKQVDRVVDNTPTDLVIVISSTWRFDMNNVHRALKWAGWVAPPIVGRTTLFGPDRGGQIKTWLDDWSRKNPTDPIEAFVIIDDTVDDILPYFSEDKIIHTTFDKGLQIEHIVRMAEILDVPLWP